MTGQSVVLLWTLAAMAAVAVAPWLWRRLQALAQDWPADKVLLLGDDLLYVPPARKDREP